MPRHYGRSTSRAMQGGRRVTRRNTTPPTRGRNQGQVQRAGSRSQSAIRSAARRTGRATRPNGTAQRLVATSGNNRMMNQNPGRGNRTARGMTGGGNPNNIPSNFHLVKKKNTKTGQKAYEEYYCPPGVHTITEKCRKAVNKSRVNPIAGTSNVPRGGRGGRR